MHADSPVLVSTPVLADSPVLVNTPVLADSAIPVNVSSLADIELPCNWTKCHSDSGIIFSKIQTTSSKGSVVTHTLTIQDDNSIIIIIGHASLVEKTRPTLVPPSPTANVKLENQC